MKVLMIGATGQFAGLVPPELKKRGATVYALVQNKDKAAEAIKNGADETFIGNLNDQDSLLAAASGMDGIFHIIPAFVPDEAKAGIAMIDAAVACGIKKFVFSGVYHPSLSMSNHAGKRPVEEALYNSGVEFVVLQPSMFMQNLDAGWPAAKEHGQVALPYSKTAKMSYVDYRDVAEAAAIAMMTASLNYGTFELSAPGMFDRLELAALMSDALGKQVQAGELPFDQWAAMVKIPEGPLKEGLRAMYANYNKNGFHGGNDLVLKTILGKEPRTLAAYIKELAVRA